MRTYDFNKMFTVVCPSGAIFRSIFAINTVHSCLLHKIL
jgi:hypothetical protein